MNQKTAPSFGAKIQRLLAIEFLIIVTISVLAITLDYLNGDNMLDRNNIYYLAAFVYGTIAFIRLLIGSIKIVFFPNSSK